MKILIVQDFLRSGGTERQSLLLARAFAAAGNPVELMTFRPGGPLAPGGAPFSHRALQPFDTGLDWFAPGLAGRAAAFAPEVILCMGRMANCLAGRLQRRVPGAVVVGTLRTGKPLPLLFRRSLARVGHVVANSAEARDRLVALNGLPPGKISVIRNSLVFPAPAAAAERGALRARMGAGPATCVMLCVAMFRPEKNQRGLIEIAAGLPAEPDWQLWLAGDGPCRPACERLAEHLGIGGRVRFPGFQRNPAALYAAADIAVHASSSESLSNFLIEAQANGLPAVALQAQGIAECFVPGETGWAVGRGDVAGFRAILARLMAEGPAERAARAAAARTFARESFDPERQVRSYLELFNRLIADQL
jgi:glycosyltransferase involved in cell wall biosynthesis